MRMYQMWTGEKTRKLQELLLPWYALHKRDLPWRRTSDAYGIWVSETMLQQTQVRTVIPYYERFLNRFPSLAVLAEANEREVLATWAGLGYYRRATNLHRAAKAILRDKRGRFPETLDEIMQLPGVGRYTAGAVASIAFNQAAPVVDGNIRRVISRLHGIEKRVPERFFWETARDWIPEGRAADFNQAMMELGALVCTPAAPLCLLCPLQTLCEGRRRGIQNRIPVSRRMPVARQVRLAMLILESNGRILLSRKWEPDYIPGTWGLPTSLLKQRSAADQAVRTLARKLRVSLRDLQPRGQVKHGITFRRIVIDVFYGSVPVQEQAHDGRDARWVQISSARQWLTSSAFRKALAAALGHKNTP